MTLDVLVSPEVAVLLYTVAAAAFTTAAAKAIRNYRKTKSISNYWLVFAIAMGLGAALSTVDLLHSIGAAPALLDELDRWIALMFIVMLIMTAVETLTSSIEVVIE